MRFLSLTTLAAGLVGAGTVIFAIGTAAVTGNEPVQAASPPAKLSIDYPADGSIFPPEFPRQPSYGTKKLTRHRAGWSKCNSPTTRLLCA